MKKGLLFLIISVCIYISPKAQINQAILSAAGGSAVTPKYTLDWTMGEFAVETITTPGKLYTQGFHQPTLLITTLPTVAPRTPYTIALWPNPVLSILNFTITTAKAHTVFVTLASINGVTFKQYKVSSAHGSLQVDMSGLPAGTYTLTVREGVGANVIKTYQIIKG